MTDLRKEAERLYELEQEELRLAEEREREAEKERGIRGHIDHMKKMRAEEAERAARVEAKRKADVLASRMGETEREADRIMGELMDVIGTLRSLDAERAALLDRAGERRTEPVDSRIKPWVRGHMGGLAVTDEREIMMIRKFGSPEAGPLASPGKRTA